MIDKKLLHYFEGYLTDKRKNLFKSILENRTNHFTVVLEDIFQPHNTSAEERVIFLVFNKFILLKINTPIRFLDMLQKVHKNGSLQNGINRMEIIQRIVLTTCVKKDIKLLLHRLIITLVF